ncbi:MAG: glycosyltransferase family 39 protein [Candidatus Micrarchaeia archaeon]
MDVVSTEEYLFTFGITLAFLSMLVFSYISRKSIRRALISAGIQKKYIVIAFFIMLAFVVIELYTVKPTQQLFFDDTIYQGMAQQLIHTGQASMCDYGTPTSCYIPQTFHEPIGTAFALGIMFMIFGVHLYTSYATELALSALSVFLMFCVSALLLKNQKAGLFVESFFMLAPVLLVWAMPTTSDIPMLAFSLIAFFFMLIFKYEKNLATLASLLFSISFLTYSKIDAVIYLILFPLIYAIIEEKNLKEDIKNTILSIKRNILNEKLLILLLFFFISIIPEIGFAYSEYNTGSYGYENTKIFNACTNTMLNVTGKFGLQIFYTNICSNVYFWVNAYKSSYVMQPAIFTFIAIAGAIIMAASKKKKLVFALGIWFATLFFVYTSFYAGSVIYGVDWRFMISLMPPFAIFGGYALYSLFYYSGVIGERLEGKHLAFAFKLISITVIIVLLAYPIYQLYPMLNINPSDIAQAQGARFYENFIYKNITKVPSNCLVLSFDPFFFNLNGLPAAQMYYIYNQSMYNYFKQKYSCIVLDYGYWCGTPSGTMCRDALSNTTYKILASSLDNKFNGYENFRFALYQIYENKNLTK